MLMRRSYVCLYLGYRQRFDVTVAARVSLVVQLTQQVREELRKIARLEAALDAAEVGGASLTTEVVIGHDSLVLALDALLKTHLQPEVLAYHHRRLAVRMLAPNVRRDLVAALRRVGAKAAVVRRVRQVRAHHMIAH